MNTAKRRGRWLGGAGAFVWSCVLLACTVERRDPGPPPPPPRPACNGVMQMTCLPPLLVPPGACMPAAQVGSACNGLTALSEGQLTPQGCCYSVCAGVPGQCGPGAR